MRSFFLSIGERLPAMRQNTPASRHSISTPIKNSIIVTALGGIGLLLIMQWSAYGVRKHVGIASQSIFPAALASQKASAAFEKMNRDYNNAVVMQEEAALTSAGHEGGDVVSSLANAGELMRFNRGRHEQIETLLHRVMDLQAQSGTVYAAAAEANDILPRERDLADLSRKNRSVQVALETLQSDLASDFTAELALTGGLLKVQEILEAVVLVGVIVALFFTVRSLVRVTVQEREDAILRQAHAERDDERIMLRALIDNIPDFMYVKDTESRFVLANAHLASAVGARTPEEIYGKTDRDYFPPEMANAFYEDEQKVMRSGQPLENHEERVFDEAGNEIDVLTTKVPIRDNKGQVTGIAGVGRDISARKRMENALREAELKYRGIFDKAIFGIFQSTPDGRLLSVNHAMAFTFGYDSAEQMVASITDMCREFFVDPKRGVEFMQIMDRVGGVRNFECEVFCKDGTRIWLNMSIRAIRQDGAVARFEGMCDDITERKQLREHLFQAQKLESVGQLAAGIAHEINTPAQFIGDNVRFLKDAFHDLAGLVANHIRLLSSARDNTLSPEAIEDAATAVERADAGYLIEEIPRAIDQTLEGITRVATLVSAMKEFSHPGTKDKIALDLNHSIESTITVARNEWKYVANLETDFDPSLPPVCCEPGEFNQVILNLIVNAAHAIADVVRKGGPEKGTIIVQTRNCAEWAEIRIRDSGTGIPEDVRTRIFDPFFTTKEIGKGTGQGLSIARSVIVDRHGGTIHFETEEGKGTTFVIRLPHDGKLLSAKGVAA
jgi:PAS domain S-box-containing protein